MKEFTVKENTAFRLRVKTWKSVNPENLNAVHFVQESLNANGEVEMSSTYEFFLTDIEIEVLAKGLLE